MKNNKILTALGLASTTKNSTFRQLTKRLVHSAAFTLTSIVAIASFTQTAGAQSCSDPGVTCDDDGNTIVVVDPTEVVGDPIDDPEDWDWDWGSDPSGGGNNGSGGSSGGGSNNNSDPDALACLQLYQIKDEECLFDPVGVQEYNWNPMGTSFSQLFNAFIWGTGLPSQGLINGGAPVSVYQDIATDVAHAYWDNQSLSAVNTAYWSDIHEYCADFPIDQSIIQDQTDCYYDAYQVSLRLIPSFSDHAFTVSQVEEYGVTIEHLTSGNSFANWAAEFFTDINNVKECKLWFDAKDEIPNCE